MQRGYAGAHTLSNLDAFVGTFKDMQDVQFLLVGHTDQQGSSRLNFELGYRRAVSVAKHLITNIGIGPQRVRLWSQGKSGTMDAGEAADRRVELFAYKVIITAVR